MVGLREHFFLPSKNLCERASHTHYNLGCPFMILFVWSQKTLYLVLGGSSPPSSFPFLPPFPLHSYSPSSFPYFRWGGVTLPHSVHWQRTHGDSNLQDQPWGSLDQHHQRIRVHTLEAAWRAPRPCSTGGKPLWAFTALNYEGADWPIPFDPRKVCQLKVHPVRSTRCSFLREGTEGSKNSPCGEGRQQDPGQVGPGTVQLAGNCLSLAEDRRDGKQSLLPLLLRREDGG